MSKGWIGVDLDGTPYYAPTAELQLRRRTWERLLPFLEQAVEAAKDESREIQIELANVRNAAYCRTEGAGDEPQLPAAADDWLSI